jgi:hypothetical protein
MFPRYLGIDWQYPIAMVLKKLHHAIAWPVRPVRNADQRDGTRFLKQVSNILWLG